MKIYIVADKENGTIYGVFSTRALAEESIRVSYINLPDVDPDYLLEVLEWQVLDVVEHL